jgi:general L-amino acid transport system permease protein
MRGSAVTRAAFYNRPKVRNAVYQIVVAALVIWFVVEFAINAQANLEARNQSFGFRFLADPASFGISQSLIDYNEQDSYGRVFLVGLLNTLLVSGLGIVLATVLGFAIGLARLSPNWLLARLAGGYVELLRNLPLLFQILFWYLAVLLALPGPRESMGIGLLGVYLNSRGLIVPRPVFQEGSGIILVAVLVAIAAVIGLRIIARRRQAATGRQFPIFWASLAILFGLPVAAFVATGATASLELPVLRGFNFVGGVQIIPEFTALLVALATYTAAFIAEVVRAGVLAVPKGQTEAALALGLRRGKVLRLIVVPQAMRVIIPPLTNQYLNLTKNSTLAVAIGYPDLVAVFAGTSLTQTHRAIEIVAITMAVYLLISLATSFIMNLYNYRVRLQER